MSFLPRSSPLAGGKSLSKFFYDALLNVRTPSGILSLVRLICRDSRLDSYDREWLCDYASCFFYDLTGYHMEDCL